MNEFILRRTWLSPQAPGSNGLTVITTVAFPATQSQRLVRASVNAVRPLERKLDESTRRLTTALSEASVPTRGHVPVPLAPVEKVNPRVEPKAIVSVFTLKVSDRVR